MHNAVVDEFGDLHSKRPVALECQRPEMGDQDTLHLATDAVIKHDLFSWKTRDIGDIQVAGEQKLSPKNHGFETV